MSLDSRTISSLTPTGALDRQLTAADGVVLFSEGEALTAEHIRLLKSLNLETIFETDGPEDCIEIREQNSILAIPTLEVAPDQKLAYAAVNKAGSVVLAAGHCCDSETRRRLARPRRQGPARACCGKERRPETRDFMAAKKRLAQLESASAGRGRFDPDANGAQPGDGVRRHGLDLRLPLVRNGRVPCGFAGLPARHGLRWRLRLGSPASTARVNAGALCQHAACSSLASGERSTARAHVQADPTTWRGGLVTKLLTMACEDARAMVRKLQRAEFEHLHLSARRLSGRKTPTSACRAFRVRWRSRCRATVAGCGCSSASTRFSQIACPTPP